MHKLSYSRRRVAVVAALSLVTGAAGVWSQAVATSNETIKETSKALHAAFHDPQTGEHVWIQADQLEVNSSKVKGGPQVTNAWILADAWNPEGLGTHSLQFTADKNALNVSAQATQANLEVRDVPTETNFSPPTTASIRATYHTATQTTNHPVNWTSPDGSVRVHQLDAFGTGAAGGEATVVLSDGTVIVDDVPASSEGDGAGNSPGVWKTSTLTHVKGP
jgi:hypothetical protein